MHIWHQWTYTRGIYDGEHDKANWRGCSICGLVEKLTPSFDEAIWTKRYKFEWYDAVRLNAKRIKTHVFDEVNYRWIPRNSRRGKRILGESHD